MSSLSDSEAKIPLSISDGFQRLLGNRASRALVALYVEALVLRTKEPLH